MRTQDDGRPAWVHILAAAAAVLALTGIYVLTLRLSLDATRLDAVHTANSRDTLYLGIHVFVLVAALGAGYGLGYWLGGLGVAYATLNFGAVGVAMVVVLAGSQVLACDYGRNDLVRHWQCGAAVSE